jgi:hypothetical protein
MVADTDLWTKKSVSSKYAKYYKIYFLIITDLLERIQDKGIFLKYNLLYHGWFALEKKSTANI